MQNYLGFNSPLSKSFGVGANRRTFTKEHLASVKETLKANLHAHPTKLKNKGMNSENTQKKFKKTPPKLPAVNTKKENIKLAAITMIQAQLAQYDKIVIKDAEQLRTYVTNKLIEVSQCGAIKEELRALELLGKMSDVGLFTDKTEIKITHTTSAALEDTIKEKIGRLLAHKKEQAEVKEEIEDAEYEEVEYDAEDGEQDEDD